jgi:hypothetical protein
MNLLWVTKPITTAGKLLYQKLDKACHFMLETSYLWVSLTPSVNVHPAVRGGVCHL